MRTSNFRDFPWPKKCATKLHYSHSWNTAAVYFFAYVFDAKLYWIAIYKSKGDDKTVESQIQKKNYKCNYMQMKTQPPINTDNHGIYLTTRHVYRKRKIYWIKSWRHYLSIMQRWYQGRSACLTPVSIPTKRKMGNYK